jgi:hypothetical protein
MHYQSKRYILKLLSSDINGGALYYAIFVMLILNMIGMMLLTYFELTFKEDAIFYKRNSLEDDVNSAIELLSCQPALVSPGENKEIDLYSDDENIVNVEVQRWGALRKATVKARWRTQTLSRTVLFCEKEKARVALSMPERHQYISLVGQSYINGDCYLSELGLRKGNAEGKYFEGPYLNKGKIYKSENEIVKPDALFLKYMKRYCNGEFNINDSIINVNRDSTGEYSQPFSGKTLIVNCGSSIKLSSGKYLGNIILYARDSIVISKGAEFDWPVLVSKEVIIKSGFSGRLQVMAGSKIKVGLACDLKYPSFLMTINDKPDVGIDVEEKTEIKGGLMVFSFNPEERKTNMTIGKETNVYGKVYTNGDITLNGNIIGSIYCSRFVKTTSVSFYENFMFDCSIDEGKLPEEFSSFCLAKELFKLRVVSQTD